MTFNGKIDTVPLSSEEQQNILGRVDVWDRYDCARHAIPFSKGEQC